MRHRNIPKDTRTLFFTTSPRNPQKMFPEIKLLIDNFSGKMWNRDTQTSFMEKLVEQPFFEENGPTNNLDLSARDRINRAPQLLGFVNLENNISSTLAFEKISSEIHKEGVFLRQLLKFQLPSPLKPESNDAAGVFYVRPYLEIVRLIYTLDYLSRDELAIFGMQLTDWRKFEIIKNKILSFREKKANRDRTVESYRDFISKVQLEEIKSIFSDVLEEGNYKKREASSISNKYDAYVNAKVSNCYDYADACRRYLRFTGLINVDIKTRNVSIINSKIAEVEWILKNTERNPIFINDLEKYQEYLFNPNVPTILQDDETSLRSRLVSFGLEENRVLEIPASDLYNVYEQEQNKFVLDAINDEVESLKQYDNYTDIMTVFDSLFDRNTPDKPLLLEWNVWRALTMLDHGDICGNFRRDVNGLPEETAGPGIPDIVCNYKEFDLIVEVTMQSGRRQYNAEGEPVADHVGKHKITSGKPTYCLFIAPTINENVISYFYGIDQINMAAYGGKSKIIPMTLRDFMMLVERTSFDVKPTDTEIHNLLDEFISSIDTSENEICWYKSIHSLTYNWLMQ